MVVLETRAHLAHVNGRAQGRKPKMIRRWRHWRDRYPEPGRIHTRTKWKIEQDLWPKVREMLPEDCRGYDYLLRIASRACGRKVQTISDLSITEGVCLVEALKLKLQWLIENRVDAAS